jgi:hypothetical protein
LSSAHSSGCGDELGVSGELLGAGMPAVIEVLRSAFGEPAVRVKSSDDVHMSAPGMLLNVYPYAPGPAATHLLLGGTVLAPLDDGLQALRRLASALDAGGVVYGIEVDDLSEAPPRNILRLVHPELGRELASRDSSKEHPAP